MKRVLILLLFFGSLAAGALAHLANTRLHALLHEPLSAVAALSPTQCVRYGSERLAGWEV